MGKIEQGSENYQPIFNEIEELLTENTYYVRAVNEYLENSEGGFLRRLEDQNDDFKSYCESQIVEQLTALKIIFTNYEQEFAKLEQQLKRLF